MVIPNCYSTFFRRAYKKQQKIPPICMSTYDMYLLLLEHLNNGVCDQRLDKVILARSGTIPAEKFKCIKRDFPNLLF